MEEKKEGMRTIIGGDFNARIGKREEEKSKGKKRMEKKGRRNQKIST